MPSSEPVNWQPISQMPLVGGIWLIGCQNMCFDEGMACRRLLSAGKGQPGPVTNRPIDIRDRSLLLIARRSPTPTGCCNAARARRASQRICGLGSNGVRHGKLRLTYR
jgi:hypothetical protein